jgi:hypothetical protein
MAKKIDTIQFFLYFFKSFGPNKAFYSLFDESCKFKKKYDLHLKVQRSLFWMAKKNYTVFLTFFSKVLIQVEHFIACLTRLVNVLKKNQLESLMSTFDKCLSIPHLLKWLRWPNFWYDENFELLKTWKNENFELFEKVSKSLNFFKLQNSFLAKRKLKRWNLSF